MNTERVQLTTKLAYGFGQMAEAVKNTSFELFLFFYYNQVLGLSGSLVGLALLIALCVDGLTDPLIGSLSLPLGTPPPVDVSCSTAAGAKLLSTVFTAR